MLVKVRNPIETCQEISAVSKAATAGDSSLTVLNNEGYSSNDFIVVRAIGDEQAELRQIDSTSGATTIKLQSPVSFSHPVGTVVFFIPYDQVEVSRKTTASGAFSVLTTRNLEVDEEFTVHDDTGGQTTHFYRTRFKNSQTGQFSSFSAILPGTGYSTRALKPMIDSVLERTNDRDGKFTTRLMVLKDMNFAYQKIISRLIQASHEFFLRSLEIPTEDFKHQYTLPDNFREIQVVRNGDQQVVPATPRDDRSSVGYEMVGRNILFLEDVPGPVSGSTAAPTLVLINDAFDTDGTWTASDDAENVTTDTDEFKVGTGSINFDVDVSDSSSNQATMSVTNMTAQNLGSFDESGKWRVWIFLPDVTYINSVEMRWGSSSTKYWALDTEKDYKKFSFHDGWNLVEFNWADGDVTETGSPVLADAQAIDFLYFTIKYSAAQPDDEDFRLDAIKIANRWDHNSVYEAEYLSQPPQLVNEMDEIDLPEGYQYLLVDYAVGQIYRRQPEKETVATRVLRNFDKELSMFVSQSSKRTRRRRGMRPPFKRTYHIAHTDSSRIVHSDGTITPLR